jgi:hypothetical protein
MLNRDMKKEKITIEKLTDMTQQELLALKSALSLRRSRYPPVLDLDT